MKKIVIVGGHLTPALALIEALSKQKLRLIFFGLKYTTEGSKNPSAEFKVATAIKNIKFYPISAGKLQRKFTGYTLFSLLKIPVGFLQSFFHLLIIRPSLIVSFGGYLSCPVVFGGWLIGIKSITHEQSSTAGLANKINSLFCEKIFVSWLQSLRFFPKEKTQVIGNLAREAIFRKQARNKQIVNFLRRSKKLVFVTGGNQGSHFLNLQVFNLISQLSDYQIMHQAGTANFQGDLDKAMKIRKDNYLAIDYIDSENIGAVLNRADLIISRSGANTVWELTVLGKPSILIPLPIAAGNEQYQNAQILQKAGSAVILNQSEVTPEELKKSVESVFANLPKYQKNAQRFAKSIPKNASQTLKTEILNLI